MARAEGSEELFYQLGLRQFGEIDKIRLDPPPEIAALIDVALELEENLPIDRRSQAKEVLLCRILDGREMLEEYFSLTITADGLLSCLPGLLEGYTPDLHRLPQFLMRLGACVSVDILLGTQTRTTDRLLLYRRSTGRMSSSASKHFSASSLSSTFPFP